MQGRPSIHSPLLIKTLLGHFIKQEKPYERGGGSIVIGLACKFLNCILSMNDLVIVRLLLLIDIDFQQTYGIYYH